MPVKNISNTRPMGAAALRNVERQRQMAQALQGQAMQPLRGGRMAGRVYVPDSPMQGVAKLGQMLAGTYAQNKADEREAQIQADQHQATVDAFKGYGTATADIPGMPGRAPILGSQESGDKYEIYTQKFTEDGQPIGGNTHQPAVSPEPGTLPIPARPRTRQEKLEAAYGLLSSQSGIAQQFGANEIGRLQKDDEIVKRGENETLYKGFNEDGTLNKIAGPEEGKRNPLSTFGKTVSDRDKFPVGSDEWNLINDKLIKDSTHAPAPSLSLTNVQEKEMNKVIGGAIGKLYDEQILQGKGAVTASKLKRLDMTINELKADPELTGATIGIQPDIVLKITNPKSFAAKQRVEQVVQEDLRPTLGAQFTEGEGERVLARAIDWTLPVSINLKRVQLLARQVALMHQSKMDAIIYARQYGSLDGFEGKIYTISDFSDSALGWDKVDKKEGSSTNNNFFSKDQIAAEKKRRGK